MDELALSGLVQLSATARRRLEAQRGDEEDSLAARTGFGLGGKERLAGDDDAALDPEAFSAAAAGSEPVSEATLAGFRSGLEELMSKLRAVYPDDE
eukprot:6688651-Prymnesium_polylepis.1